MKLITDWYWYIVEYWQWYLEYHSSIRLHFYVSVMINNYPILVVCKFDDPHADPYWCRYVVQFLWFKGESIMYLGANE